jgi:benzoyl-CoA reductase/2-hydroxyglutaryl-CoA dehydratase subunit BcrC/BadD/HgdB
MPRKYPRFRCFDTYNEIMGRYYLERKALAGEKRVAYVTSGAPVEVLEALDVLTIYPENFGALCGARKVSVELCEIAETAGYAPDLCSYAKGHIAASWKPDRAPLGGLPPPDMLVCCNNICGTVLKWYETLADFYRCPLFLIDVPFQRNPELEPHIINYIACQMEDFIAWSEDQAGKTLDPDRLVDTLKLSREAVTLWTQIREMGRHRPSPINAPELFLAMAPVVVLRGTQSAVDFYRLMKAEAEERHRRRARREGATALGQHRYLVSAVSLLSYIRRTGRLLRRRHLYQRLVNQHRAGGPNNGPGARLRSPVYKPRPNDPVSRGQRPCAPL